MQKYIVAVTWEFEKDDVAYVFDTWEEACEYMQAMWKWCIKCEYEDCNGKENSFLLEDMTKCDMEEGTAVMTWGSEYMEGLEHRYWNVIPTSEPLKFPKDI